MAWCLVYVSGVVRPKSVCILHEQYITKRKPENADVMAAPNSPSLVCSVFVFVVYIQALIAKPTIRLIQFCLEARQTYSQAIIRLTNSAN